jgi:hypothetical protein
MRFLKISGLLMAATIILFACKKTDHPAEIKPDGAITIHSPENGSNYKQGDTVSIHALLKANTQLHGYRLYILRENGDTVLSRDEHAHNNELEIREKWVVPFPDTASLKLIICTALDHHGSGLEQAQKFRVN